MKCYMVKKEDGTYHSRERSKYPTVYTWLEPPKSVIRCNRYKNAKIETYEMTLVNDEVH